MTTQITPQSYSALVKQFTPLDLILFKGNSYISDAISLGEQKAFGDGEFSHSAILITSDVLPSVTQLIPGRWYIWESTVASSGDVPNIETGTVKIGVQIRDLEQVVTAYTTSGGKTAWAKLLNNPWNDSTSRKSIVKTISDINNTYGTQSYDFNCCDLLAVAFPCLRRSRNIFDSILYEGHLILTTFHVESPDSPAIVGWQFCSELVARVYQAIGIIDPKLDPRNFAPVSFIGATPELIPCLVVKPVYITPDINRGIYLYSKIAQ